MKSQRLALGVLGGLRRRLLSLLFAAATLHRSVEIQILLTRILLLPLVLFGDQFVQFFGDSREVVVDHGQVSLAGLHQLVAELVKLRVEVRHHHIQGLVQLICVQRASV